MTKFGTVTVVGRSTLLARGQQRPHPKGWGRSVSKIFGTVYMHAHVSETTTKICIWWWN